LADARGCTARSLVSPGYAGVGLVAADHRIQRAVAADFLIDDDVDVDVALGLETGRHQAFHRHDGWRPLFMSAEPRP
jgi:hypothetical protein